MAIFNYAAREMTAKIVYYGPGLSGKTTSIQYIHTKISPKSKGKLVSLATETDRTLFFDFFPVEFGQIGGFKVKFNFYTVPGQVFYNTTRKLVLKGADGVVFVADSQSGMMEQNLESLTNLKENLKAHGIDWETVPFIIQYNKRDLPGVMGLEEMRRQLNLRGVPDFETSATAGDGIMEAMKAICKMVLEDIQKKQKRSAGKKEPQAAAAAPAGPREVPAAQPAQHTQPPTSQPAARPAAVAEAPGVERTVILPIKGPGVTSASVSLPLEFQVGEGVEGVQVNVQVKVTYLTRGAGEVTVKELNSSAAASAAEADDALELDEEELPRKKGFFGRLFGGG